MAEVTTLRYIGVENAAGNESVEERDALICVELGDPAYSRPIDLHLSPRTDDVATCSLSAEEAWRLSRELARAATEAESYGT